MEKIRNLLRKIDWNRIKQFSKRRKLIVASILH